MKKVLVLVTNYPNNNGNISLMYVHVRNKYYIQHGIDVTVLNFSADKDYEIENIPVITLETYKKLNTNYDILVLHAANIRNHYCFLKKYEKKFPSIIFFFHGHEVLKINKTYPKPYDYMRKSSFLRTKFQDIYDEFKLSIWRKYLPLVANKAKFVFVSNCFFGEFKKFTGLNENLLKKHVYIINNSVGKVFEENNYQNKFNKKYDFITIRNMLDQSVYCIDLLCKIAENNPNKKFLLIGKGQYFKYNMRPENIEWIDKFLNHDEMLKYVDQAKCALMLTRRDTQGVMSCELATYGIPIITSKLEICQEIFEGIKNVSYIENDNLEDINLSEINMSVINNGMYKKTDKFSYENTVKREIGLILSKE